MVDRNYVSCGMLMALMGDLREEEVKARQMVEDLMLTRKQAFLEILREHKAAKEAYNQAFQVTNEESLKFTQAHLEAVQVILQPKIDAIKAVYKDSGFTDASVWADVSHTRAKIFINGIAGSQMILDPETVPEILKPWAIAVKAEEGVKDKLILLRQKMADVRKEYLSLSDKLMREAMEAAFDFRTREFQAVAAPRLQAVLDAAAKEALQEPTEEGTGTSV